MSHQRFYVDTDDDDDENDPWTNAYAVGHPRGLNARGLPGAIRGSWRWQRRTHPDGSGDWEPVPLYEIVNGLVRPGDVGKLEDGSIVVWCRNRKDLEELALHTRAWDRRGHRTPFDEPGPRGGRCC